MIDRHKEWLGIKQKGFKPKPKPKKAPRPEKKILPAHSKAFSFVCRHLQLVAEGKRESNKVELPPKKTTRHKQVSPYIFRIVHNKSIYNYKFIYKGDFIKSSLYLEKIQKFRDSWLKERGLE